MQYPVHEFKDKWYNAQGFGAKTDYGFHEGCDLNLKTGGDTDLGQELLAVADGEITAICNHIKIPSFGKHLHLKVETKEGTRWFNYCHCQDILVTVGTLVKEGQLIAHLGKSGTTVAHLHFACKKEPTGVDGLATTAELLTKWEDPLLFIERMNQPVVEEDNRYWVYYKGAKLTPPYETNPKDTIATLENSIIKKNEEILDKAAELSELSKLLVELKGELERQGKYNEQMVAERDTARKERDDLTAEYGRKLEGIQTVHKADLQTIADKQTEQVKAWQDERTGLQEALQKATMNVTTLSDLVKELKTQSSYSVVRKLVGGYYLVKKKAR